MAYRNGCGDTPLHITANRGGCEAISALLPEGADVNSIGESGFTSFHCAAEQKWPEAIILLRKAGASMIEDADGETPLRCRCAPLSRKMRTNLAAADCGVRAKWKGKLSVGQACYSSPLKSAAALRCAASKVPAANAVWRRHLPGAALTIRDSVITPTGKIYV